MGRSQLAAGLAVALLLVLSGSIASAQGADPKQLKRPRKFTLPSTAIWTSPSTIPAHQPTGKHNNGRPRSCKRNENG